MRKKLFCKHDYKLVITEKYPSLKEIHTSTNPIAFKLGAMVVCEKCGKHKKKLEKQILNLIAKERIEYYNRSIENEYQRFYHQG